MDDDPNEEFDRIVKGLDFDLPFPQDVPEPEPAPEPEPVPEPESLDDVDYRHPVPPPPKPFHRGRTLSWTAIIGGPMLMMVATVLGFVLPRTIVYGIALIFVAAAIYLVSQLPEHGPGHPDSPDDGAEL